MSENLVSIIVPIYGVERYIRKCIESLIHQSYSNIEILLIDDGSEDDCPRICDEYQKRDDRIIVVHKGNGGLVSARKSGVKHAKGEYILFVDGDDWIHPDYTKTMVEIGLKTGVDCVECGYYRAGKSYQQCHAFLKEGLYKGEAYKSDILKNMLFAGDYFHFGIKPNLCLKLLKKDILAKVIFEVPDTITLGEDAAVTYPYLLNSDSIYIIHKPLYYYRYNPGSMCNSYSSVQSTTTIDLICYMKKYFGKFSDETLMRQLSCYHLAIATSNFCNEMRAGVGNGFLKRYRKLKQFANKTSLKDSYHMAKQSVTFKRKNKYVFWLYVYFGLCPIMWLCAFVFSCKNCRRRLRF